MMTLEELKNNIIIINKLVEAEIKSEIPDTHPIADGIIDVEKYFYAKYKILWILKEPYDEFDERGNPCGGGWSLPDIINEKKTIYEYGRSQKTFKPMIYASWGILNNFCLWKDMTDVEEDTSMLEILKSIAYINVKKLPGYTESPYSVIKNAYLQHKDILNKQIEYYNPDIIIGGYTLPFFFEYLGFTQSDMKRNDSNHYIIKDNKIFISAYHPAQRNVVSQEQYCNDIIAVVKEFNSISK